MDAQGFDAITKIAGSIGTRRRVVGALLAAVLTAKFDAPYAQALAPDGDIDACVAQCREDHPPGDERGACIRGCAGGQTCGNSCGDFEACVEGRCTCIACIPPCDCQVCLLCAVGYHWDPVACDCLPD